VTNSGSVGGAAVAIVVNGNGNASLTNSGTIAGGATIEVVGGNGTAILTNYAGSRIIGSITMVGPAKNLNFVGGNFLYTLNSLAGVTINTNGAPFAVNGNSVAVLDPTALALEDRGVMNFTAGVSSMLQDRFRGMPVAPGASGGAIGFAPDAASRIDAAHEAFAGLSSVSMAYSSTEARRSNANAMYSKAPPLAVPVYDTVVWASGFGGERRQWENGLIQRATDTAYGGAIGVDRQFTPDLRLGVFAGGGSSKLRMNLDLQRVDSDYVFGGGYGRWDRRNYYVDFALFGGGISSNSTRQISNNLVANGLEIATAGYKGWFISPDVTYGYRVFMGDYVITPKARVRYVGGSLDGYSEVGSAQGLVMGKRALSDIEERLGVEFSSVRPVTLGGTLKASVDISGIGLQRLGDNTINAVLLAQNIAFTTPGSREAYGGVVNVGLDWRPKSNVSIFASAEATAMNDKSFSAAGKGGVRIGF
jgi:outer membrane autotransporter protein